MDRQNGVPYGNIIASPSSGGCIKTSQQGNNAPLLLPVKRTSLVNAQLYGLNQLANCFDLQHKTNSGHTAIKAALLFFSAPSEQIKFQHFTPDFKLKTFIADICNAKKKKADDSC